MYNIIVYNEERQPIATLEPVELPEESDVVVYLNVSLMSLASEKNYEVEITVKSVLSTNSIQKTFGKYLIPVHNKIYLELNMNAVNSHFNGTSSSEDKAIRCKNYVVLKRYSRYFPMQAQWDLPSLLLQCL